MIAAVMSDRVNVLQSLGTTGLLFAEDDISVASLAKGAIIVDKDRNEKEGGPTDGAEQDPSEPVRYAFVGFPDFHGDVREHQDNKAESRKQKDTCR